MAGDDVDINIRASSQQAQRAFRDLKREASGLKGTLIPLATAATPLMAAMSAATLKVAGSAAGAGVAVGAFGAAVAGQVSSLTEAADAQEKYNEAVVKSGRGSKEAAEAQRAVQAVFAGMPASTARAAIALGTLKDGFQDWSDSVADFTMTPVEKSFTVLGELVPRLTDMAKGASSQLDRLVTVAGGAIATPGFDALSEKLSVFANEALRDAVDGVIHFARALSEGQAGGPVQAFMEYANSNGPALRETLSTIGDAVTTLVQASAEAGPGMLTLVNAAAGLVAALPPELVATVMQLAVGLKLVTLAGAGAAAISGGIAALGAQITALRAASAAAGGGMAGLAAAFATLGTAAKASIVVAGIAAVAVAFGKLGEIGREAPPNIDRLTTSLGQLGRTGKASGEAARLFGSDLDKLYGSVRNITDPSVADNVQNALVKVFSLGFADSTPWKEAREWLDGIDEGLTNLVKGGKTDEAAAAFKRLSQEYVDGGGKLSDFTGQMDGYKAALADVKFEQDLIADSMGIFGEAAQDTSAKLEAQKGAADGLRASILALNDVNRSAHDAQTQFGEALDGLTESFKEHGATLSADTEAGRANRDAMSAAAAAQDELIASGLAAGESLGSMTKKSDELRETMMRLATEAFDGNKAKAREYVNTLLGVPGDIKTLVKLEREEAITGLKAVQAEIDKTPGAKTVTVETLNGAAIKALEAVGLKTRRLPDGRTEVFTKNGQALGPIGAVNKAMNNINGKTSTTYLRTVKITDIVTRTGKSVHEVVGATGGLYTGRGFKRGYADGGPVVGPGTGTSDEVFAPWLSNGEFVMREAAVQKYGEKFMQLLNEGRIDMPRMAKGGKLTKKQKAAAAQKKAEQEARQDAWSDLTISHFGQMAGYKRSEFGSALARPDSLADLVNSLNKWRSIIKAATHGAQEKGLLKALDSAGKKLLSWEKQLGKVEASLSKAKDKLNDLKSAASQLSGSVKSGVLGAANITRGAQGAGPVTVASIMGGLTASRDKATAFASALKDLQKKGLSASLIQQIAEAGIEGGGLETAGALLGASSSEIKSLNSLQSQIAKAATSAGKTTADAVYGAAIKAQTKLVNDLKSQQKKLTDSMENLAKSMEKLVEAAFKGKAAGGIVGAAASGGIRSNRTWVGEQGPELLDLPPGSRVWSNPDSRRMQQQAWASMLNVPQGGARRVQGRGAVVGAGGRAEPLVLELRSSGSDIDELLLKILRKAINVRGGNVQIVLTGRSG